MALVNCPECGKENVSDSAVSCPACGYAVKDHFNKIKMKEIQIQEEKARKEEIEAESRRKKETEGERQIATIANLEAQIDKASKEIKGSLIGFAISLPLTILYWYLDGGFLIFLFAFAALLSVVLFFFGNEERNEAQSNLALVKENFAEYEKKKDKELKAMSVQAQAQATKYAESHPNCPNCGSNNTERISVINRTASVATLGLASSKIGKQYQCKNCKHKW